jgi:hypothetical protein
LFVSTDLFLNDALTARVRAQGIWNRSWGFRRAYYDYLAAHLSSEELDPFDLDTPSDDELPALYQLDIGLTYEPGLGWADLQLRVDILNLLNRPNVVDWSLSQGEAPDAPFELLERILPQRTVALSARLGF